MMPKITVEITGPVHEGPQWVASASAVLSFGDTSITIRDIGIVEHATLPGKYSLAAPMFRSRDGLCSTIELSDDLRDALLDEVSREFHKLGTLAVGS
ncbi:MAG TPA: hypothetical protein VGR36_07485 [Candidatus Acidoferrales bacterium]|nr:hypothetical protein [Candidatus Acidoferrales bacterium]